MGNTFSKDDIFLLRAGFGQQDGNACAMLVFENGWGLLIEQDDLNPSQIPLEDTKFRLTIKRTSQLLFNKTAELCTTSDHPIESMQWPRSKTKLTLEQAATIATQLSALEPLGEYSTEEIVDYALEEGPHRPSQIENKPISTNNGMELDSEKLRKSMQKGKLRGIGDYDSPMKFELFYGDTNIPLKPSNKPDEPYLPITYLLPTGHVAHIISKGSPKAPLFDVTTLIPDKNLRLHPAYVRGISDMALQASWEYAIEQGGETQENHQPYSKDHPTVTDISLSEVKGVMNDLIKRRSIVDESLIPQIALANRNGHNTDNAAYPITQFNGEEYDPNTGKPIDLFSFTQDGLETPANG